MQLANLAELVQHQMTVAEDSSEGEAIDCHEYHKIQSKVEELESIVERENVEQGKESEKPKKVDFSRWIEKIKDPAESIKDVYGKSRFTKNRTIYFDKEGQLLKQAKNWTEDF